MTGVQTCALPIFPFDLGFSLPEVKWELSSRRVMTLGWAEGLPLGDNAALDAAGHDRAVLSERVLQLFLQHALRDGYFHADMHQGNLKVAPNGDIIALDFEIGRASCRERV